MPYQAKEGPVISRLELVLPKNVLQTFVTLEKGFAAEFLSTNLTKCTTSRIKVAKQHDDSVRLVVSVSRLEKENLERPEHIMIHGMKDESQGQRQVEKSHQLTTAKTDSQETPDSSPIIITPTTDAAASTGISESETSFSMPNNFTNPQTPPNLFACSNLPIEPQMRDTRAAELESEQRNDDQQNFLLPVHDAEEERETVDNVIPIQSACEMNDMDLSALPATDGDVDSFSENQGNTDILNGENYLKKSINSWSGEEIQTLEVKQTIPEENIKKKQHMEINSSDNVEEQKQEINPSNESNSQLTNDKRSKDLLVGDTDKDTSTLTNTETPIENNTRTSTEDEQKPTTKVDSSTQLGLDESEDEEKHSSIDQTKFVLEKVTKDSEVLGERKARVSLKRPKPQLIDRSHMKRPHYKREQNIQCKFCTAKLKDSTSLFDHAKLKHSKAKGYGDFAKTLREELKVKCSLCDKDYSRKEQLTAHMALVHSPNTRVDCTTCGIRVKSERHLQDHIRRIHGNTERIHLCHLCPASFKVAAYLAQHLRHVHTNKESSASYQCDSCTKTFSSDRYLQNHITRVHGNKRHVCGYCGKSFTTLQNMTRHVSLMHEKKGEKPYKCEFCSRGFSLKANLKDHVNTVHMNTYSIHCEICNLGFRRKKDLQVHEANAHGKVGVNQPTPITISNFQIVSADCAVNPSNRGDNSMEVAVEAGSGTNDNTQITSLQTQNADGVQYIVATPEMLQAFGIELSSTENVQITGVEDHVNIESAKKVQEDQETTTDITTIEHPHLVAEVQTIDIPVIGTQQTVESEDIRMEIDDSRAEHSASVVSVNTEQSMVVESVCIDASDNIPLD